MENPYQQMQFHDPALFHALIHAFNPIQTPTSRRSDQFSEFSLKAQHTFKPYICPECKKGFKNCFGYKIHRQDHTGEKKYKCEKCPYETNNSSNFDRHKARATSCLHKSAKKRNNESKKPFI
jgi:hypothetical protein